MKLKTRLLCYTAAVAVLSAGTAFAAIDGQSLADQYLAEGFSYVEVTVGPTQTKVEAIKSGTKIEAVYDNETLAVIKQDQETADASDQGRTGAKVRTAAEDFEDDDDDEDDDHGSDDDEDDDQDDDHDDDDRGDDHDDDHESESDDDDGDDD